MKKIALYLPQYHAIKENDEWWGKGYTEWSAVKRAKPLFKGHVQPRVPLNGDYYDLSDEKAKAWKKQAELAKKYGLYGFCIYHYWFETGKQLLEKPAEILLRHPEIDLNYCFCWANETWTRTWYGKETSILREQKYLDETEWKNHFEYLLKFFQDPRYIKENNCPMICIYKSQHIPCLKEMLKCWRRLAVEAGFDGLYVVSGNTGTSGHDDRVDLVDAYYNHEPGLTDVYKLPKYIQFKRKLRTGLIDTVNKVLKTQKLRTVIDIKETYRYINRSVFDESKPTFKCIFPRWDNTPRRGYKGACYINENPKLFKEAFENMLKDYDAKYFFINAWNEWGEGCYLEADEQYKYAFLNTISELK